VGFACRSRALPPEALPHCLQTHKTQGAVTRPPAGAAAAQPFNMISHWVSSSTIDSSTWPSFQNKVYSGSSHHSRRVSTSLPRNTNRASHHHTAATVLQLLPSETLQAQLSTNQRH
jgi:hypothetical protein